MIKMKRSDIVQLKNLSTAKGLISCDAIPASFEEEFNAFFLGKTIIKDVHNHRFVYSSDVKKWVYFLFSKY